MKPTHALSLFAAVAILAGCTTPAQTYAGKHSELSSEHRRILLTGKIPDGAAVAGMTREQVRLAMGVDPTQFTKLDNMDAWVFEKEQSISVEDFDEQARHERSQSNQVGSGSGSSWLDREPSNGYNAPVEKGNVRTTVLFNGDHAVRAEVEKLKTGGN